MPPQFKENAKKMKEKAEAKKEDADGQGQEQQKKAYADLRSAVIHVAHTNPAVRQALKPVLQIIKQQG